MNRKNQKVRKLRERYQILGELYEILGERYIYKFQKHAVRRSISTKKRVKTRENGISQDSEKCSLDDNMPLCV